METPEESEGMETDEPEPSVSDDKSSSEDTDPISIEQVKSDAYSYIVGSLSSFPPQNNGPTQINSLDDQRKAAKIRNLEQEIDLKKKYADAFLGIARWMLVGAFFTIWACGMKLLNFEHNELPIFIAGVLAEVFGIVFVIASSLFRKGKRLSLDSGKAGIEKMTQMLKLSRND